MSFSKITRRAAMALDVRSAFYIISFGLVLAAFAFAFQVAPSEFEPRFSDNSPSGMAMVPASCESNFSHFTGECDPNCSPVFYCQARDVYYRGANCQENFVERCDLGCLNGRCIQANCPTGNFCSGPNLFSRNADCSVTLNQVCPAGCSNGACNTSGGACSPAYFCAGNDLMYRSANCDDQLIQTCPAGCAGASCLFPPSPLASITAQPALVRAGDTTRIAWTSTSTVSCVVTGTNGDSWSGTGGSATSMPIPDVTVFTLNCVPRNAGSAIVRQVTVNIIPVFEEL